MIRPAIRLRVCDSGYETRDGRYVIERQDDVTECEHPLCDPIHRRFWNTAGNPGVMDHWITVPQWHVWDNQAQGGRGDYVDPTDSRGFDTKRAACRWFADYLAKTYKDTPDKLDLYLAEMM